MRAYKAYVYQLRSKFDGYHQTVGIPLYIEDIALIAYIIDRIEVIFHIPE